MVKEFTANRRLLTALALGFGATTSREITLWEEIVTAKEIGIPNIVRMRSLKLPRV